MNNGMELLCILMWLIHSVQAYNSHHDSMYTSHIPTPSEFDSSPTYVPNKFNENFSPSAYDEILKSQLDVNGFYSDPIFRQGRTLQLGDTARTLRPVEQNGSQRPQNQHINGFRIPEEEFRSPMRTISNTGPLNSHSEHSSSALQPFPNSKIPHDPRTLISLISGPSHTFNGNVPQPNTLLKHRSNSKDISQQEGAIGRQPSMPYYEDSRWDPSQNFNSDLRQNIQSSFQSTQAKQNHPPQSQSEDMPFPYRQNEGRYASDERNELKPIQGIEMLSPLRNSQDFSTKPSYRFTSSSPLSMRNPIKLNSPYPLKEHEIRQVDFFNQPSQNFETNINQENRQAFSEFKNSHPTDFEPSSNSDKSLYPSSHQDHAPPRHENEHSSVLTSDLTANLGHLSINNEPRQLNRGNSLRPYQLPHIPFENTMSQNSRTVLLSTDSLTNHDIEQPDSGNPDPGARLPVVKGRKSRISSERPERRSVSSRHSVQKQKNKLKNSATSIRPRNEEDSESVEIESDSKSHSESNSGPLENEEEQEEHDGFLDMGAYTDKKGSFGWYADFPVGRGHDKVTYS